jgi:hypothetical protein
MCDREEAVFIQQSQSCKPYEIAVNLAPHRLCRLGVGRGGRGGDGAANVEEGGGGGLGRGGVGGDGGGGAGGSSLQSLHAMVEGVSHDDAPVAVDGDAATRLVELSVA